MKFSTMNDWLTWITGLHGQEIDLSLDRVKEVAKRLGVLNAICPIIIVGGTNGKGSTVASLEAIYLKSGYTVGAFTSPILFKPNEYIRLNGVMASDEDLCNAFAHIEKRRRDIKLTPFEWWALAAFVIFYEANLNVWILEVGLGGRLDAVNVMDADVAIVTSISLDHTELLGPTVEAIGFEKAGIFRKDKAAICGDDHPPQSLIHYALQVGARLYRQHIDFSYQKKIDDWSWKFQETDYDNLPLNGLYTPNLSCVLMAITLLQSRLPVSLDNIKAGLASVTLPGRIQIIHGDVTKIYDVAHNPGSIALLKKTLDELACAGKTIAVFSMLGDKNILTSLLHIKDVIDEWYVAPLQTKRGATLIQLREQFANAKIQSVCFKNDMKMALAAAQKKASKGDQIIIFGSFHVLTELN